MNNVGVPAADNVYTGPWVNWSRGRVFGATITLGERDGNFLIAFIALFVAFAGTSLFRILCFFAHLRLSSEAQRDAIHHQRQAVLRNSESGLTALWAFTKMLWSWKRKGKGDRPLRRVLPLVIVITAITLALMAAGVSSSEISAFAGDEVLISSPNCGTLSVKEGTTIQELLGTYASYDKLRAQAFRSYAQDCYSGSDTRNCNRLVRTRLSRTVDTDAPCPFDAKICRTEKNIRIDSGLLDTHTDLGINAPGNKRIQFRHVMHCAPLNNTGYSERFQFPTPNNSSMPYVRHFYGPSDNKNWTYLFPNNALPRMYAEGLANEAVYTLVTKLWSPSKGNQTGNNKDFEPIQELRRNDSDVMVAFLSPNTIVYVNEVNDPWYSAHNLIGNMWDTTLNSTMKYYGPDDPVSALGCTMKYQTCLPSVNGENRCSKLDSLYSPKAEIPGMSEDESELLDAVTGFLQKYPLSEFMINLGQESLTSRYTLGRGIQGPINDTQWQLDMQRWFDMSLAAIQMTAVDTATGPSDPALGKFLNPPSTTAEDYFCKNQKIRSTAHSNFSVFGIALTFSLGGVIVLIHWSLESLYKKWLWRFCHSRSYATIEWNTNGILQLQRLAHEGAGSGVWKCCDDGTPLADGGSLASLDIRDRSHPVLDNKVGVSPWFARNRNSAASGVSIRQARNSGSRPISGVSAISEISTLQGQQGMTPVRHGSSAARSTDGRDPAAEAQQRDGQFLAAPAGCT